MNKRERLTIVGIIGAASSFASVASADTNVFTGSICVRTSGAALLYNGEGAIRNQSATDTAEVECPLPRDNGTATGTVITDASVWVINPGPANGSVSCTLSVEDNDTGTTLSQVTRTSSSISSALQELNFPVMNGGPFAAFHLSCSLPASIAPIGGSALRNISVEEP